MTKEQLDAIRARVEAATPGPWEHTPDRDVVSTTVTAPMFDYQNDDGSLAFDETAPYCVASLYYGHEGSHPWHDAELIANAPTDLHALLAEVERLTGEVESKVTQNVALVGMNGKLQQEVERLTTESENRVFIGGAAYESLMASLDSRIAEVNRLRAERDTAFKRGVAAMREAARTSFVNEAKKWQSEGDGEMELRYLRLAGEIRALPDPEDKNTGGRS